MRKTLKKTVLCKMTPEEFGQYLLKVKFKSTIEFALDYVGPTDEWDLPYGVITEEGYSGECWFFIKGMEIKGYNSRFWLCDYAGGDEAQAIPVYGGSFPKYPCLEDREYIPEFWMECWKNICSRHNGYQNYLFVEMEADE